MITVSIAAAARPYKPLRVGVDDARLQADQDPHPTYAGYIPVDQAGNELYCERQHAACEGACASHPEHGHPWPPPCTLVRRCFLGGPGHSHQGLLIDPHHPVAAGKLQCSSSRVTCILLTCRFSYHPKQACNCRGNPGSPSNFTHPPSHPWMKSMACYKSAFATCFCMQGGPG